MSDTDTDLDFEQDLERMKMEAALAENGMPIPVPDDEDLPGVEPANNQDDPSGGEDQDGDAEHAPPGSTDVDPGTDSEDPPGDEPGEELSADDKSGDDGEAKAKTRKEKKADALERNWQNADKRHKEADTRAQQLDAREAKLAQFEQQLKAREKPSPKDPLAKYESADVAASIGEFIDEGDIDTAKQLAVALAQKAEANKAHVIEGPGSEQFEAAREQVRQKVIKDNPELSDSSTPLFKTASALLGGDWGAVLGSHPAGIAAAVEVAKLQTQAASVPALNDQIEQLKTEISQLKRSTSLGKTGAASKGKALQKARTLDTVDDDLEELRQQAKLQFVHR